MYESHDKKTFIQIFNFFQKCLKGLQHQSPYGQAAPDAKPCVQQARFPP